MADNYKDELRNTLVGRSMKSAGPTSSGSSGGGAGASPEYPDPALQTSSAPGVTPLAPTGLPAPPPAAATQERVPPAWQRYSTGLKMQRAYANNWQPNPIILKMMEGR